jgi:hypothetical protein
MKKARARAKHPSQRSHPSKRRHLRRIDTTASASSSGGKTVPKILSRLGKGLEQVKGRVKRAVDNLL